MNLAVFVLAFLLSTAGAVPRRSAVDDGLLDGDFDDYEDEDDVAIEGNPLAADSDSFRYLKKNTRGVLENLPSSVVDQNDKTKLLKAFDRIFLEYEKKHMDELQPADDRTRRLPYGTIHRLAHMTIDDLDLESQQLQKIHRAIHVAFSESFSPNVCYPQFAKNHTGCLAKFGKDGCPKLHRGLDEADKSIILAMHDQYRSEVARGQAMVGDMKLPPASSMAKMAWDGELAYLAQAWADQCTFETDCAECRRTDRLRFVGQNLIRFKRTSPSRTKPNWRLAIDTWARRSKKSLPSETDILGNYRHDDTWAAYTQMIWDFTYLVGCGYAMYYDEDVGYTQLYVCNYGPAGNVIGSQVYERGRACAKCPRAHVCDKDMGMCTYGEVDEPRPKGFVPVTEVGPGVDEKKAEKVQPESAAFIVEE